jgi:hypothetical protein
MRLSATLAAKARLSCAACGRSGRYSVKRLLAQRGDPKLTDFLGQISSGHEGCLAFDVERSIIPWKRGEGVMPNMDYYTRYIEEVTIPALRKQLEPMEAGMKSGVKYEPGPWIDTTQADIKRLKEWIAEYEDILHKLRAGEAV